MKKTLHSSVLQLTILLTFIISSCASSNYPKIMGKSAKNVIGKDISQYQLFSYPTDNFGLATSHNNTSKDEDFICDMWKCIGITSPPSDQSNWINLNNFAANGAGGSINLTEKEKNIIAFKAILPKIYDVVGVTGGTNIELNTDVTLTISQAVLRKLRKQDMTTYLNSLDNNQLLKQAFNNGSLVLVVADCVVKDMAVKVKTNNTVSSEIDAKLGITGSSIASKVFSDASLTVKVDKTSEGEYLFKVEHPVIIARLFKKQPGAGALAADDDFSNWITVIPASEPAQIHP